MNGPSPNSPGQSRLPPWATSTIPNFPRGLGRKFRASPVMAGGRTAHRARVRMDLRVEVATGTVSSSGPTDPGTGRWRAAPRRAVPSDTADSGVRSAIAGVDGPHRVRQNGMPPVEHEEWL
ncbi:hypothetical protein GCM10025734_16390 [Kitasatospora paranensis]